MPKKSGGLQPILDLRVLNRALHKLPFKMLPQKRIFGVRPSPRLVTLDLVLGHLSQLGLLNNWKKSKLVPTHRISFIGMSWITPIRLHQPAAKHLARGQIPCSPGAGMLWYSWMPRPPAGEPHTMSTQCQGIWTGPQLGWHINCLELLALCLALSHLRGRLRDKDVLACTENTATVAYINQQGGLLSCRNSPATSSFGVRSI